MNILYTINDKFVPQAAAGICSICENNKDVAEKNFYIMGLEITDESKEGLEKLVAKYGAKITFIDLQNIEQYFDFEFDTTGWNSIVLARLLIGKLLPADMKRVIYLDGDTIVRGSLKAMWSKNLHGKTLAMCAEPTVNRERKESLGLRDYYYHNAGVLLVDLERWREISAEKIILDYYAENNGRLFANDQDAINGSLKDEIAELLPKYNFSNIYTTYPYKFMRKLCRPRKYISEDLYNESLENPVIIHYLGEERPWRRGNTHKFKDDYKKYLGMTQWADTPDEEGWTVYFMCWRIFNLVMKPFPALRYGVMDKLIPLFIKYRSKKK